MVTIPASKAEHGGAEGLVRSWGWAGGDPSAHTTQRAVRVPVSLTQQSSLLMAPYNPSREFMSWVYQLNGRLDHRALARAIDDVVAAHDVLRVRFEKSARGLTQVVTPFRPGVLQVVSLEDRPKLLGLATAVRAVEAEYKDLDPLDDPRLRATLYRIDSKCHVLSIFVAEALVDGESGSLVAGELSTAYARHAGKPLGQHPRASEVRYCDYVRAHPVPEAVQARALEHWRTLSAEPVAAGCWPTALGGRVRSRFFAVPAERWQELVAATPGMATMPFVVVLAWLEMALCTVTGAERFLVTSAVAHRSRPEARGVIGNFVGPIRMLAEVAPHDALETVSARVVQSLRQAMAAGVVPVPLAEARLREERGEPFAPPEPTVSFYMFTERNGPDLAGVRQRRFRVHAGRDVLRMNVTPDATGGRNVFLLTRSADGKLLDALVTELRRYFGVWS